MKYIFKCKQHGEFIIEQSMKETTPTHECPQCGEECNKVIQRPNVLGLSSANYNKV